MIFSERWDLATKVDEFMAKNSIQQNTFGVVSTLEIMGLLKNSSQNNSAELLAKIGVITKNLEYSAYNLCDGKKYTDLPKGIRESTGAEDTLLIAIRDLKNLLSQQTV